MICRSKVVLIQTELLSPALPSSVERRAGERSRSAFRFMGREKEQRVRIESLFR